MVQHPKDEMVTARVIFVGVMFGCINKDKRYEVGMIPCPLHSPLIRITTKGDGKPKELIWPAGHDLIFKVWNPQEKGIRTYPTSAVGVVPEADFKLVLDVEGPHLHAGGITVNTALLKGRRIGVTDGLLYAHQLTDKLDLNTWTSDADPGTFVEHFGKIANHVGLNIDCPEGEGNGIAIVDAVTGKQLHLMPALPGVNYAIEVNNDCNRVLNPPPPQPNAPRALVPGASDFRFNYKVLSPKDSTDKRRFDFKVTLVPGQPPRPNPDVCNVSGGGGTTSIGFDWSKL